MELHLCVNYRCRYRYVFACRRGGKLVKLQRLSSEEYTVMISGGCLDCSSQFSKQNILHLWALCASNWIKILNGYLSFRKFEHHLHFFCVEQDVKQCLVSSWCYIPLCTCSACTNTESRWFTEDQVSPWMLLRGLIVQKFSFFINITGLSFSFAVIVLSFFKSWYIVFSLYYMQILPEVFYTECAQAVMWAAMRNGSSRDTRMKIPAWL